jgi:hypothetical protein
VPEWLRPSSVAVLTMLAVALLADPVAIGVLRGYPGMRHLQYGDVALPALLVSAVLILPALRSKTMAGAALWCILGGPVAGAVAGLLTLVSLEAGRGVTGLGLESAVLGVPFGGGFGLAMAWAAGYVVYGRERPSHDSLDRAITHLGAWLFGAALAATAISAPRGPAVLARLGLAMAILALFVGGVRRIGRHVWLRRVRAGRVPGWAVEAWDANAPSGPLLQLIRRSSFACDGVLVHRPALTHDPYRGQQAATPLALVSMSG